MYHGKVTLQLLLLDISHTVKKSGGKREKKRVCVHLKQTNNTHDTCIFTVCVVSKPSNKEVSSKKKKTLHRPTKTISLVICITGQAVMFIAVFFYIWSDLYALSKLQHFLI